MTRKTRFAVIAAALFLWMSFWASAAGSPAVTLNKMPVYVQQKQVAVQAYNIDDYNYFKLRDIAESLKTSEKQFSVVYSYENNAIYLSTGMNYLSDGSELAPPQDVGKLEIAQTTTALYINGMPAQLRAYNVNGNNYYKLKDLGSALDFSVEYDQAANSVLIECAPETPDVPVTPEKPDVPSASGKKVIYLDAGHGGSDTGTINKEINLKESDINYEVAIQLKDMLEKAGYSVVFSRGKTETLSLTKRMERIRELKPDLVVSVHHNATNEHTTSGAQILAQVADRLGGPSKTLANLVAKEYEGIGQKIFDITFRYNSTKTGDYYGLLRAAAGVKVPAIISEFAFMDNETDVKMIDTAEKRAREAEALFRAIDAYFA